MAKTWVRPRRRRFDPCNSRRAAGTPVPRRLRNAPRRERPTVACPRATPLGAHRPTTRLMTARSTPSATSMAASRPMLQPPASRTRLSCTAQPRSHACSRDRPECPTPVAIPKRAPAAAMWTARAAPTGGATAKSPPHGAATAIDARTTAARPTATAAGACATAARAPFTSSGGRRRSASAGNCRTDSDCGQDGYCSPTPALGCGPQSWSAYYCHTLGDQCVDDADCDQGNAYCAYDTGSSRWVCSTGLCIDG